MKLRHSEEDYDNEDFVPPELRAQSYEPPDVEAPVMIPDGEIAGVDEEPRPTAPSSGPSREELLRKVLEAQNKHEADKAGRISKASKLDRKRQTESDIREYLRAAFTGGNPQLRNLGKSHTEEAMASGNQGPLSRELALQNMLSRYKPADPLASEFRQQQMAESRAREAMYGRANQPKPEDPLTEKKGAKLDAEIDRIKNPPAPKPRAPARGGGGNVPATVKTELAGYDAAIEELSKLEQDYQRLDVGGAGGRVASWGSEKLGLNNDYTAYLDSARRTMQAVGTILEKGKLAAGDEAKYRRLLPEAGDSPERVRAKVAGLRDFLGSLKSKSQKALGMPDAEPRAAPSGVSVKDLSDGSTVTLTAEEWAEVQQDPEWQKKVEVIHGR